MTAKEIVHIARTLLPPTFEEDLADIIVSVVNEQKYGEMIHLKQVLGIKGRYVSANLFEVPYLFQIYVLLEYYSNNVKHIANNSTLTEERREALIRHKMESWGGICLK